MEPIEANWGEREDYDAVTLNAFPTFGNIYDGLCEERAYIIAVPSGGFALYLWNQDGGQDYPDPKMSGVPFPDPIKNFLDRYDVWMAENGEDLEECLMLEDIL